MNPVTMATGKTLYPIIKLREEDQSQLFEELDQNLFMFMSNQIYYKLYTSENTLNAKAKEYAGKLNLLEHKSFVGWVDRFKKRHQVIFGPIWKEMAARRVDIDWINNDWKNIQNTYGDENIFNATLFCFYFRSELLSQNIVDDNDSNKKLLWILICANATGKCKRRLWMYLQTKKPRTKFHIPHDELRFELWNWDESLRKEGKHICILYDNNLIYASVPGLTNIRQVYLPNETTLQVPLEFGIVKKMILSYRKRLLMRKKENDSTGKISFMTSVYIFNIIWSYDVSDESISKSFRNFLLAKPKNPVKRRDIFEDWGKSHLVPLTFRIILAYDTKKNAQNKPEPIENREVTNFFVAEIPIVKSLSLQMAEEAGQKEITLQSIVPEIIPQNIHWRVAHCASFRFVENPPIMPQFQLPRTLKVVSVISPKFPSRLRPIVVVVSSDGDLLSNVTKVALSLPSGVAKLQPNCAYKVTSISPQTDKTDVTLRISRACTPLSVLTRIPDDWSNSSQPPMVEFLTSIFSDNVFQPAVELMLDIPIPSLPKLLAIPEIAMRKVSDLLPVSPKLLRNLMSRPNFPNKICETVAKQLYKPVNKNLVRSSSEPNLFSKIGKTAQVPVKGKVQVTQNKPLINQPSSAGKQPELPKSPAQPQVTIRPSAKFDYNPFDMMDVERRPMVIKFETIPYNEKKEPKFKKPTQPIQPTLPTSNELTYILTLYQSKVAAKKLLLGGKKFVKKPLVPNPNPVLQCTSEPQAIRIPLSPAPKKILPAPHKEHPEPPRTVIYAQIPKNPELPPPPKKIRFAPQASISATLRNPETPVSAYPRKAQSILAQTLKKRVDAAADQFKSVRPNFSASTSSKTSSAYTTLKRKTPSDLQRIQSLDHSYPSTSRDSAPPSKKQRWIVSTHPERSVAKKKVENERTDKSKTSKSKSVDKKKANNTHPEKSKTAKSKTVDKKKANNSHPEKSKTANSKSVDKKKTNNTYSEKSKTAKSKPIVKKKIEPNIVKSKPITKKMLLENPMLFSDGFPLFLAEKTLTSQMKTMLFAKKRKPRSLLKKPEIATKPPPEITNEPDLDLNLEPLLDFQLSQEYPDLPDLPCDFDSISLSDLVPETDGEFDLIDFAD